MSFGISSVLNKSAWGGSDQSITTDGGDMESGHRGGSESKCQCMPGLAEEWRNTSSQF